MKDRIPYYIEVIGSPTESEDAEVAGTYLVEVDADLEEGFHASAALDCFHANVAIACLDDFSISVFDQEGNDVEEMEVATTVTDKWGNTKTKYVSYDSSSLSLEKRAEFCGEVDPDAVPARSPGIA